MAVVVGVTFTPEAVALPFTVQIGEGKMIWPLTPLNRRVKSSGVGDK